eukprot:3940437-Rhodomonas_salina.3
MPIAYARHMLLRRAQATTTPSTELGYASTRALRDVRYCPTERRYAATRRWCGITCDACRMARLSVPP